MAALLPLVAGIVALVLFDIAALRYGADSRGGIDHDQYRIPRG
jgi:hypothetical protein